MQVSRAKKIILYYKFKLYIYEKSEQEFEDFFCDVMLKYDNDFEKVKPQGSYGDRKNDGFNKKKGEYYQVYSPSTIKGNEQNIINKIINDFDGLYSYWQAIIPIQKYNFVLNDKYDGAYASVHKALIDLGKKYKGIQFELITANKIENIFFDLKYETMLTLLDAEIVEPDEIGKIDSKALNEVIKHILKSPSDTKKEVIPDDPNFNKKIGLNKLSEAYKIYLKNGRIYTYMINDFFEYRSPFEKEELRKKINGLYLKGKRKFKGRRGKNNIIFEYIKQEITPNKSFVVDNAVKLIMAYYFEYCDIFESV